VSVAVEHDKRKREILERALDVFQDEGYADTTFQKIADRCGITRTILYLYFKNKREVFTFSIKRFTEKLEESIRVIALDESLPSYEKLYRIESLVLDGCVEQARLLSVISDYLSHIKRSGGDAYERVRRRTIRMRHIIAGIVIAGQKRGELARMPVKPVTDLLYSIIEGTIFRVTLLDRADVSDTRDAARLFIERMKA